MCVLGQSGGKNCPWHLERIGCSNGSTFYEFLWADIARVKLSLHRTIVRTDDGMASKDLLYLKNVRS